jgi:hypothetical protein
MTYRLHAHVLALARALPEGSPYRASAVYHAGCAELLDGREDAAFEWFARFKREVTGRLGELPIGADSHFNVAFRQGTLIEDAPAVEALGAGDEVARRLPEVRFDRAPKLDAGDAVLAAACDRRYFQRFAQGFVTSLAAVMPTAAVHFHVIEADEATLASFAALEAAAPGLKLHLSTEAEGPFRSGAYYASSRFLIGPALLDRYGVPLVLLDVDVEFAAPLEPLLAAAGTSDFACFRHDGPGPCSRYPAVLGIWAPSPGGLALIERVRRAVLAKLEIPWPFNWMLDQAALGSAMRWARKLRPDIRLGILNELTGQHFEPWLKSIGGGEEKAAMIRDAAR